MNSQDLDDRGEKAGVDRRRDLFEVLVLLLFIVPPMLGSFFVSAGDNLHFPSLAFSVLSEDLALMGLVLFFLWRNGEPLASIGWKLNGLKKETALGVALFLPAMVGLSLAEGVFQKLGLSTHMTHLPEFLTAVGPLEMLLACVLVIVVAIVEETIFRGYLLLRFNNLTGSISASILISSVLFSIGHGYEGPANLVTLGLLGIILALICIRRKSLVAPTVLHMLIDFYALVLMPLAGLK